VYHVTFCASKLFFWVLSKFVNSISGDANNIQIGSGTNIQDNSLVHVAKSNLSGKVFPTIIGENVTVGKYLFESQETCIFL
jgi:carbonic anhydrase/acetyltransferase-like protein (isoleucine patch superfamily)